MQLKVSLLIQSAFYHVLILTGLDVGQLIKDPYFTLFESVGALEVSFQRMQRDVECQGLIQADHGPKDG